MVHILFIFKLFLLHGIRAFLLLGSNSRKINAKDCSESVSKPYCSYVFWNCKSEHFVRYSFKRFIKYIKTSSLVYHLKSRKTGSRRKTLTWRRKWGIFVNIPKLRGILKVSVQLFSIKYLLRGNNPGERIWRTRRAKKEES